MTNYYIRAITFYDIPTKRICIVSTEDNAASFGNGYDTMPAAGMNYLGGRYFTTHRRPVGRWFPARNWCVLIGTVVIMVLNHLALKAM